MKKLIAYCEKIGVEYYSEKYGSNYFYNVDPLIFDGLIIAFDYESRPAATEAARERMIERYCKRYGYTFKYHKSWPGCRIYTAMKTADNEKLQSYLFYQRLSVSDCEKLIHEYAVKNLSGIPADDKKENSELRQIMDQYGNNLNDLFNDLYQDTKTA